MDREILHSSKSNEWYTPARYIDAVWEVMGFVTLDPASSMEANKTVKASIIYDRWDDGLSKDWFGSVFLNPPYGKSKMGVSNQATWSQKLFREYDSGRVKQAIMLVNAVPGNAWFAPLWDHPICFTDHRIRFVSPDGQRDQPTHGNAFVYLGDATGQRRFAEVFKQFGPVVMPSGVVRRSA